MICREKTRRLALAWGCLLWFAVPSFAQNTGCPGALGPNVFPNGDLGTGLETILPNDPGIAPSYWYTTDPPPVDGAYCVANSTVAWDWFAELFWLEIGDNSPDPNGYMMVVNADYQPGIFYQRTVQICENTPYIFSADIINLFLPQFPDAILPNVDFLINGGVVFSTGNIPMDMQWHTYEFAFTPPTGSSQFTFALRNNAPGGFGNDLCLDNISLRFCGPEVTLPNVVNHCAGGFSLQPSFEGNPWQNAYYQWQTSMDGGNTWTNLPGANSSTLFQSDAQDGQQFRVLVGGAPGNLANPFCRAVSNVTTIVSPVIESFLQQTICAGESVQVGGSTFTQSGSYQIPLASSNGCDSLLHLDLTVLPGSSGQAAAAICEGESYLFGDQSLTTGGDYTMHLTNSQGCDSLLTLHLVVNPVPTTELFETICQGESLFFGGAMRTTSGVYTTQNTLPTGCDSTTILHLELLPALQTQLSIQICEGTSYAFGNQTLTASGQYQQQLQTASGCDSMVTLTLAVLPQITAQISASICQGSSYQFGSQALTVGGQYQQQLQTASGCDSLVTLTLAVSSQVTSQVTASICQGSSYQFGNQQLTASGQYQQLLQTANGCDSLVTLTLTVSSQVMSQVTASICQGSSYQFGSQLLTTSGQYQQLLQTASGCDSLVTLILTISSQVTSQITASICQGSSYQFGSQQLTISGQYQQLLHTASGCDSLVTLTLAVSSQVTSQVTASICQGSSYQFGSQQLTTTGQYQQQLQTVGGCDSLVTLTLAVLPTVTSQVTASICQGSSYQFGNQQLTTSGQYQLLLQTAGGCDSLVTLTLVVSSQVTSQVTASICQGSSYQFGSQQLTAGGQYQQQLQTAGGCDSLVTLTLAVLPTVTSQVTVSICQGSSYQFGSQQLTASGQYQLQLQTAGGCDSLVTLTLAVLPTVTSQVTASICQGSSYQFGAQQLAVAGQYQQLLQTADGCDSVVTLTLTVLPLPQTHLTHIICEGETCVFGNTMLQISGTYQQSFQSWQGCDSLVVLDLTVLPDLSSEVFAQTCEGEPFDGNVYQQDTIIVDTLASALTGCDSVVTIYLTVWPVASTTLAASRCWGEEYEGVQVFSDTVLVLQGQTLHGCDSTTTCTIIVHERLLPEIQAPQVFCSGEVAVMTVGAFAQYQWSTDSTSAQIQVSQGGQYDVTVTDTHGCTATDSHELVASAMQAQAQMVEPRCHGEENGEVSLYVSGGMAPYLTSLNGGSFEERMNYTGLGAGNHHVQLRDQAACELEHDFHLDDPPTFELEVLQDTILWLGETFDLQALSSELIYEYVWSPATGLNCSDCPSPTASPLTTTLYKLLALTENGCEAEGQALLIVRKEDDIYIPNGFSPNGDGTNDFFTVYPGRSVVNIKQLQVFDRWGEQVFIAQDAPPFHPALHWDGHFRGMPAQTGVYVWFTEIEYLDGSARLFKGDVTLVR